MRKRKFDNTVFVIGGDHHNTLAAVRCFGREGYHMKVCIMTDNTSSPSRISGSRYAHKCTVHLAGQKAVLDWLIQEGKLLKQKGIIVPCSDLAEYTIDSNYSELSTYYFLPGFHGCPGRVATLMDKFEQKKFADVNHIKMAESWTIDLASPQIEGITLPCILKPQVSAYGSKADIIVAHTIDELNAAIKQYNQHNYKVILCQQFLTKKYEVCAYGYIPDGDGQCEGIIIKKIHENQGGSTAFAQIIEDEVIENEVNKLSSILKEDGYSGLYDYEYLICEDGIYLNEINFRQSGNGYATVNLGFPSSLNWACSVLQVPVAQKKDCSGKYHMDDIGELIAVKHRRLSFWGFMKEVVKSRNCAVLNLHDLAGTVSYYKRLITKR